MRNNESLREAAQFTREWDGSECYVQINFDPKTGKYYMNAEASQNSWRRYDDPNIVYIGTYQGRLTQKFIREETQKAVEEAAAKKPEQEEIPLERSEAYQEFRQDYYKKYEKYPEDEE